MMSALSDRNPITSERALQPLLKDLDMKERRVSTANLGRDMIRTVDRRSLIIT